MADEETQAAPEQAEAASEQPKPEETKAEKPRSEAEDRFREYQRRKDRELAEIRKAHKEASARAAEADAKAREYEALLAEAREAGRFGDDDEARAKARLQRERELEQREERARNVERSVTIMKLSQEFGVPAETLEAYDDPLEMKIAALEWERQQRLIAGGNGEEPPAQPPTPPEESPAPRPRGNPFDTGNGALATKSIDEMSSEEFSRLRAANKARYRRQAASGN